MQLNSINTELNDSQRAANVSAGTGKNARSASGQPASVAKTELAPENVVPVIDKARLENAVQRANDMLSTPQRGLEFSIDEQTEVPVISVVDKNTEQLVRQIPSEVVLNLIEQFDELKGMLFDAEA